MKTRTYRVHFLNYFPDWVQDNGNKFDANGLCESLLKAGVNSVEFVAKEHNGNCYYMTEIGPRPKRDWLGEFVAAAKPRGMEVLAYYSLAWDTWAATTHPNWSQMTSEGKPFAGPWMFRNACLNTPYRDYVLHQLREIVSGYDVDSIWIDLVDWAPCYCSYCKKRYSARYGEDLPTNPRDTLEHSIRFEEFQGESRISFMRNVAEIIRREKPSVLLSFNGSGKFGRYKGQLSEFASFHSREGTMGPDFLSRACKTLSPQNKPYELIAPGGKGWFSWVLRPEDILKLESSIVYAQGGNLTISINPFPNGSTQRSEIENISRVFEWVKRRNRCFQSDIASNVADVAILWTKDTTRRVFGEAEEGVSKTLLENHFLFDIIQEGTNLGSYKLVILPSGTALLGKAEQQVRKFVRKGSRILCIHNAALVDERGELRDNFSVADILGLDYKGSSTQSTCYLRVTSPDLMKGLIDYPLLSKSPALNVEGSGCDILAEVLSPIAELDDEHWVWPHVTNPPALNGQGPAITISHDVKGAYVSCPIDRTAAKESAEGYLYDPWSKRLLANLIGVLVEDPLIRTNAPAGVEVLLRRGPDGFLLHAFNKYAAVPGVGDGSNPPKISGLKVWLNRSRLGPVDSAELLTGENALEPVVDDSWLLVPLPELGIHCCASIR